MLILASKSPRRSELLNQAGYPFRVEVSEAEEIMDLAIEPAKLVQENAFKKAQAVVDKLGSEVAVVGADTIVSLESEIFGKPKDLDDAKRMLRALSGKEHYVSTGVVLIVKGNVFSDVATTKVRFGELSEKMIEHYIQSGEPMGKAGAYAVQGRAAVFIKGICGSYSNVVGLPLYLLTEMAKKAGVDLYGKDGA